jgi:GSH-dependent disulfide-bond oxidoreductase
MIAAICLKLICSWDGGLMIHLYYWTTPNGHKITIYLEETTLPYSIKPINISPNNRIPAIVDDQPGDGGAPLSIFESGAILQYLAEKTGQFLPKDLRGRAETMQWLFWQMGGLGPMLGQNHHFSGYAPEKIPYAIERYRKETERLYGVLDDRLADREFIAGGYSIADMAAFPWIVPHQRQEQDLDGFPHVKRWFEAVGRRAAVQRAYDIAKTVNTATGMSESAKSILFGQGRRSQR